MPASRAATTFWTIPPIGPTRPSNPMVPVVATRIPPVNSPGVRTSRMARLRARPAELPPTWPVLTRTLTGRSSASSNRVWGATPRKATEGSSSRDPSRSSTSRGLDPSTASTSRTTWSPGRCELSPTIRSSTSRTGTPARATMTSSVVRNPSAGPETEAIPTPVA